VTADLLSIDSLLTEVELAVRDTVARFLSDRVRPHIAGWYRAAEVPRDLIADLGAKGLLGMHLAGYDCAGMSAVAYGLACLELEACDSGLRSIVSVQGSLAMFAIHTFGSEEQKREWLPRMARGEAVGCFGLTEPDAGSDPSSMRTRARRAGSDWILNGTKTWITNGTIADVAIIWAHTKDGIRGFAVPTAVDGFDAHPVADKLSLRASVTSEIVLEDCRLPADAMLPGAAGLGAPLRCLQEARYGIVWGAMGAARDCYLCAVRYAIERNQFGKPVAAFQLTQAKLAHMSVELNKGMLLAIHLGRLKDRDREVRPHQVSMAKLANVRTAIEIARTARTILGANGISLEYPVMRHANNLESVLTYEGTEEVHTLIVGQAITGLPAFR
jgi:glutaryl-CoA dehydrogenase